MKKFGFTLTELLITIAIVGVAAAIAAPAITNIMPDKTKMMFIKNYNELLKITEEMVNNPELYYPTYAIAGDEGVDLDGDGVIDVQPGMKYADCFGLGCMNAPIKSEYQNKNYAQDSRKYSFLLSQYLGVEEDDFYGNDFPYHFRTPDRTCWRIGNFSSTNSDSHHEIHLVYNYEKEESCKNVEVYSYGSTNKIPNTFRLKILNSGEVIPLDALSKAYLVNPTNMQNRKFDLACAEAIYNDTSGKTPVEICESLEN